MDPEKEIQDDTGILGIALAVCCFAIALVVVLLCAARREVGRWFKR